MPSIDTLSDQQFFLLIYGLVISTITFFCYGYDKLRAELGKRRVSERTLWILALIGGSLGALLAMHFFRHKTKKLSFQAVLALILLLQIILILFPYAHFFS